MKAYHRVDPLMDERKGHYSPSQLGCFLKVQLLAGRQTRRGRFRSVEALKGMLPATYARHVAFLVEQGDIIPAARHSCELDAEGPVPRGEMYVDGWCEWQEGDLTVGERMKRLRNKRRNGAVTDAVTQPSPTAIGVGVGVGVGSPANAGVARDIPPVELAARRLLNGGGSEKQIDTMLGLVEQLDEGTVLRVLGEWEQIAVKDRYGGAMAELRELAAHRKKGRRGVQPTTNYDRLMESDDDEPASAPFTAAPTGVGAQ